MDHKIRVFMVVNDKDDVIKEVKKYFSNLDNIEVFDKYCSNNNDFLLIKSSDVFVNKGKDISKQVANILHSLGFPCHLKGYNYLLYAIILVYNNSQLYNSLTKDLYPVIAKKYHSSLGSIERAIRNAIDIAWTRGDYNLIDSLFGNSLNYDKLKPTNGEFIMALVDYFKTNNL